MTNATNESPRTESRPGDRIRAALKAAGIARRSVSVRFDGYSMGATIRVRVLDAAVPLALVREIAKREERVRRDEATGEILAGGNTFVDVEYAAEAIAPLANAIRDELSVVPRDGGGALVRGLRCFRAGDAQRNYLYAMNASGHEVVGGAWSGNTDDFAARQIALHILSEQHAKEVA